MFSCLYIQHITNSSQISTHNSKSTSHLMKTINKQNCLLNYRAWKTFTSSFFFLKCSTILTAMWTSTSFNQTKKKKNLIPILRNNIHGLSKNTIMLALPDPSLTWFTNLMGSGPSKRGVMPSKCCSISDSDSHTTSGLH